MSTTLRGAAGGLLLLASVAHAQTWKELGPAPISGAGDVGRVSAIACSPIDPNKYFVGGADGGVWRTIDGGATWMPLTDQMPTTAIGALAIDPTNENIIYAGTGEANFANHSRYGLGLYKSITGGASWTLMAQNSFAGRCFSRILINPANTQRLYASITRAGGFPELAGAKGHPGATLAEGVFRSDTGGTSWTLLAGGLPALTTTDLVMAPDNPNILYAAIGRIFGSASNGIYKSVDGGDSWTKLAGGLPTANVGRIAIAVAPNHASRLYAVIAHAASASGGGGSTLGAYKSSDAGATWTPINAGSFQSTYGWYLCVVTVQPAAENTVIMGGLDLLRTTNGGTSFSTITSTHVDNHALAWDAAGRLLLGDDGGVQRSTNLGGSWTAISAGLGTAQFYAGLATHPTNPLFVTGGLQDNGCVRRSTDTKIWDRITGGDGGWTQIDQSAPLRLFTESQGTGALNRSVDGGNSFSYAGNGIDGGDRNCFLPPYLIDPTNSNHMLYATHRIYESTNGGSSWTPISPDLTGGGIAAIRALAMAPSVPSYVYAATNDGRVLVSTNGGTSFVVILTDHDGWPRVTREITVDPNDPKTVYLAGATFDSVQIRRSTNAGATWTALDANFPDLPVNVIGVDPRGGTPVLYVGSDAGVYRSRNLGGSWQLFGQGLPRACVIDIQVDQVRNRLIVGTQGRGAWSVPICVTADFNGDGQLNIADFVSFQTAFALGNHGADYNGDGLLNISDFVSFQTAFALACP